MKQKTIIRLVIVAVVIIAIIAIIVKVSSSKEDDVEVPENETTINASETLSEEKTYNGLEFTEIKFTNSSSFTKLSAAVTNTTSEDMEAQIVDVRVLDKDGNIITTFSGTISALKAGEQTTLNTGGISDTTGAYSLEFIAPQ